MSAIRRTHLDEIIGNLLFLMLVVVLVGCSSNNRQPQEPHPVRFVGTWKASKQDFYNDNYAAISKTLSPESYANFINADEVERRKFIDGHMDDNLLVNRTVRFMENGLAEVRITKRGTPDLVSIWKWTYAKGEIRLFSDTDKSYEFIELVGELIEENPFDIRKQTGVLKVRFLRVP